MKQKSEGKRVVEYLLAVVLVVGAVLITAAGYFAVRKLIVDHTELLQNQAQLLAEAKEEIKAELHQKASADFEKIVEQNAEFIKKDLRQTGESMNAYVRTQFDSALRHELRTFKDSSEDIGKVSKTELSKLQRAIADEQAAVVTSFKEEQKAILEDLKKQHGGLVEKIDTLVQEEASRRIEQLEGEMARIVTAYVHQALADRMDVDAQVPYILDELEKNKQAIIEDIRHAA